MRVSISLIVVGLLAFLGASNAHPQSHLPEPDATQLRLHELWLGVTDITESIDFYTTHLGWELIEQADGYAQLGNSQTTLVMIPAAAPVHHTRYSVKTMFNFYVDDVRAKRESFLHAGVRLLDDEIYEAAVGDWFGFFDPSGTPDQIFL